jgi:hypothetical protein
VLCRVRGAGTRSSSPARQRRQRRGLYFLSVGLYNALRFLMGVIAHVHVRAEKHWSNPSPRRVPPKRLSARAAREIEAVRVLGSAVDGERAHGRAVARRIAEARTGEHSARGEEDVEMGRRCDDGSVACRAPRKRWERAVPEHARAGARGAAWRRGRQRPRQRVAATGGAGWQRSVMVGAQARRGGGAAHGLRRAVGERVPVCGG